MSLLLLSLLLALVSAAKLAHISSISSDIIMLSIISLLPSLKLVWIALLVLLLGSMVCKEGRLLLCVVFTGNIVLERNLRRCDR